MSNAQHTPGPWRAIQESGPAESLICADSSRGSIELATAYAWAAHENERLPIEANARLIAAAPELLDALEILIANAEIIADPRMDGATDCYAVPMDDIDAARAAIAKARGQA